MQRLSTLRSMPGICSLSGTASICNFPLFSLGCLTVSVPSSLWVWGGCVLCGFFFYLTVLAISAVFIEEKQQKEKLEPELHYYKQGILCAGSFQLISFGSFTYVFESE